MNREALIRYAELKADLKKITDELDMLAPAVLSSVKEAIGQNEYMTLKEIEDVGRFSWYEKKKWVFSGATAELEEKLEQMKKDDKATGAAKYTEDPVLKFTHTKHE